MHDKNVITRNFGCFLQSGIVSQRSRTRGHFSMYKNKFSPFELHGLLVETAKFYVMIIKEKKKNQKSKISY